MRINLNIFLSIIFIFLLCIYLAPKSFAQTVKWQDNLRKYRIKLSINSNTPVISGKPLEVTLNFSQLLQQGGQSAAVNLNSLRLIEADSTGDNLEGSLPYQFDVISGSSGKFIFLSPEIPANTVKNYYLYFDTAAGFTPFTFTKQIDITDNVLYEGQPSFKFNSNTGTSYYHKAGAGFAALKDREGKDWLSYKPTGGSAGNFRGIPNMVHPEGFFHPGSTGSESQIISKGPLKVTVRSVNGNWSGMWEMYPSFSKMTVNSAAHSYWFLYEGTPNGAFNPSTNFMVLSNGERFTAGQSWTKDISSPEWIYFSDSAINRSLFLSHLEDDQLIDSYKPLQGNMTVFGFGRDGTTKNLTVTPYHFIVGFIETNNYTDASRIIKSYSQNTTVSISALEVKSTTSPTVTNSITHSITPSPTLTGGLTRLNLSVLLHGIGNGGDNANPNIRGTIYPQHPTRTAVIEIFNTNNQLEEIHEGNIQYNSPYGNFTGTIDINDIPSGYYTAWIKVPQFLKKPFTGIVKISSGQTISLPAISLITGDVNNDNRLSILDYNLILDCYSELTPARNCSSPDKKLSTDITDDGDVNQFDYNLFLREMSTQIGQ